jgi:putative transposase
MLRSGGRRRMRRTSVVELVVDEDAVEKLKLICSLSSNLWNEVNYVRRRMLFGKRGVDLRDTYREFYEKYKLLIGSATAQQVLNKKDEAWKSFFKLLKLKKEGMLPPFINKVNPLGYRKKNNRRTLWAVLRKDQYRMEGDKIVLKGLCGPRENRTRLQGFNTLEGRGWRYTMT